jgi:hypothetical protein
MKHSSKVNADQTGDNDYKYQSCKIEAVLNYQVCKEVCINQERKIHFYYPALTGLLFLQQLKLLSQVQWCY